VVAILAKLPLLTVITLLDKGNPPKLVGPIVCPV
jgi:hypothetical protein